MIDIEKSRLPIQSMDGDVHSAGYGDKVYDVYKLIHIAESLPTEAWPIEKTESQLYDKYWGEYGPSDIIDAYKASSTKKWEEIKAANPALAKDIDKMLAADYKNYPLLAVPDGYLLDGMHRLTHAWIDGAKEIGVKRLLELPDSALIDRNLLKS